MVSFVVYWCALFSNTGIGDLTLLSLVVGYVGLINALSHVTTVLFDMRYLACD